MQATIKSDTEILSCTVHGNDLIIAEAFDGPVWVLTHEFGAWAVTCALSFESALEAFLDELPAVPADELHEAYGLDSIEELQALDRAARDGSGQWPELEPGYSYQGNATGTGVVYLGDYWQINPLTRDEMRRHDIKIEIGRDE